MPGERDASSGEWEGDQPYRPRTKTELDIAELANRVHNIELSQSRVTEGVFSNVALLAAATMYQAGLVRLDWEEDGGYKLTPLSASERPGREQATTPLPRQGFTKPLMGDGGPLAWVMTGPAPHNDVQIVCSPDASVPLGMRCRTERKMIGGETEKLHVVFMDDDDLEDYTEWLEMLDREAGV